MKTWIFAALLLAGSFALGQDNAAGNNSNGQMTVQGCVSRSNGDYILMKTVPAITYELQATGKTRLKHYLGQRVEVTGSKSPTLSSSSDATSKEGSAAPQTLTITSIKTLDKDCSERNISR
jgi:Leucine-rich repeat (LRR) protein